MDSEQHLFHFLNYSTVIYVGFYVLNEIGQLHFDLHNGAQCTMHRIASIQFAKSYILTNYYKLSVKNSSLEYIQKDFI